MMVCGGWRHEKYLGCVPYYGVREKGNEMKNNSSLASLIALTLLLVLPFLCVSSSWAKGNSKGSLDSEEIYFIKNTLFPILIKARLCVSAEKDCSNDDNFICLSHDALACDAYGIADEKVIKEILLAVLNSGLKIESFKFWRTKYHEISFFEKPLLEFIDRTGRK